MIKETLKNILLLGVLVLSIWSLFAYCEAENEAAKARAIEKCGVNNITEKRTSQGDLYYTCLVER